jgi:curved DNA-binding protein CbpA
MMDADPLPDHFKALGVERNADSAAIKKAHRLLVLKCHPDKVTETDPVLKQQKAEQFHKIQKAYEVLIDEKERATYEANLTLEALRKEKLARGGAPSSRDKSTRFESRPSGSSSSRYATEERRPSAAYDDDEKYYDDRDRDRARTSTRSKYDTYSAYPKSGSSPRTEKESSRSTKATTERHRSERTKARDKDERRNHKFVSVDSESSSADEKARYEADYKRRSQEDEARRQGARKADDRRSYEDPRYDSSPSARKMSSQAEDAIRYLHKSRAQVESEMRPSMARTSSRDYYESSRSSRKESSRPEPVRRSSARPKDRPASSSARDRERDRAFPEIVEWDGDESSSRRMPPSLSKHSSSPANIEIPRTMPQRSYTSAEAPRDHRTSTSPPPAFHRSQTMPSVSHTSSRSSKPATVSRPSTLRETMTPEQSNQEPFPSVPVPQPSSGKSTKYYYPTPNGGVPLRPDDILAGGHRTVLREPGSSQRHRSPEAIPLSRPPIGANRPSEANISKTAMPPPPMGRSSSSPIREERGRSSRPLYGEVGRDSYARPRPTRQGSYNPSDVQYAPKYGPEDVRWAPRGRENDRDYPSAKPSLGRTATYVY